MSIDKIIYYIYEEIFSSISENEKKIVEHYKNVGRTIIFLPIDFSNTQSIFEYLSINNIIPEGNYIIDFFYSMRDLICFLGEDGIQKYFKNRK